MTKLYELYLTQWSLFLSDFSLDCISYYFK